MSPENREEVECLYRRIHELMLEENVLRDAAGWSFNGWTADGRAVRHHFKVEGYERTGPAVEQERIDNAAKALMAANARLIAAAPDGLDLAYAVARPFDGTDATLGQQARDFIAKATGDAPAQ
jgi:hypothetical protein